MTNYHEFFHQSLQLSRCFVKKLNDAIRGYNLNHSQLIIIYYLKGFGSSTLVDMASNLNLEKSSVTRTVNRLEKSGLIRQVPAKDKRERRILLSDSGEDAHAICLGISNNFLDSAMDGLPKEELAVTMKILLKIKHNINEFEITREDL